MIYGNILYALPYIKKQRKKSSNPNFWEERMQY